MATATEVTVIKKNGNGNSAVVQAPSDDFVEYKLDLPSFNPEVFLTRKPGSDVETYEGPSLQGAILAHRQVGTREDDDGHEVAAHAYLVRLEKTTKVRNRDKEVIEAKAGDVVLLWPNAQLKQAIPIEIANHPTHSLRVRITPLDRKPMKTDAKRKMWSFKIELAPPATRKALGGGANYIAMMQATLKALPQTVETTGEEAPF